MARTAGSTAESTRARILEAACALFEQQGFAGTSIRDLAARVGMTKAALYYHFPSKEEVLEAVLTPFMDEIDQMIAATASGRWSRAELVTCLVGQLRERGDFLTAVLSDPSVKQAMFKRLGMQARITLLLSVLAGSDDPRALLRSRCALGALMSGIMASTDGTHHVGGAECSPEDQKVICAAVLAALGAEEPAAQ